MRENSNEFWYAMIVFWIAMLTFQTCSNGDKVERGLRGIENAIMMSN